MSAGPSRPESGLGVSWGLLDGLGGLWGSWAVCMTVICGSAGYLVGLPEVLRQCYVLPGRSKLLTTTRTDALNVVICRAHWTSL